MATTTNRLTTRGLATKPPGMHADGQGLYLRVDQTGGRSWVFIFFQHGRRREMGLGSLATVGLARAREKAGSAREVVQAGGDPIAIRKATKVPPQGQTFEQVASKLLDELERGWKSPKQRPQWEASLQQHAAAIWKAEVAVIDTEMVLSALQPIWNDLPETAQRIRGRIERVLDAARVRGLREGENPARWKGHLSALLSGGKRQKVHHAAMGHDDVPILMTKLATRDSVSAMALRFVILTACRSGEVRGARWSEISGKVWTIPPERMKAKKEHRVPLSTAAMAVLEAIPKEARGEFVFPGPGQKPLSDVGVAKVLRLNGFEGVTVHGFRSTFRDWAGDCTPYPRDLIEEALAHQIGNAVERAYRRSDALEKRRGLMEAWSDHCSGTAGNVTQLPQRA
ncbi:Prophage CP4-57 integrase [compost metagenome]